MDKIKQNRAKVTPEIASVLDAALAQYDQLLDRLDNDTAQMPVLAVLILAVTLDRAATRITDAIETAGLRL